MAPSRDNHPIRPTNQPTYRFECSIVRFAISSSSARHQFVISSSSVRHQFVISSSSARHQLVISSSSARHQFVISSSSEKKGKREKEKERKKEKKTDSRNGLGRAPTYNRKILRRVSTQLDNLSICHQSIHLSYHL